MVYYLVYKVQLIYIRISSYPFRLRNIYNYLVSSGIMSDIDDDLTDDEIKILELLGRLHVSQHKNINEATIRKKLPQQYHSNLKKTIKSLISKGLVRRYRNENYSLNAQGKKIAEDLAKKLRDNVYSGLHILLKM